ncbi:signal peptidase I, archaeal type [Archaeoglobus sulfaticallidus PM70-1]|uniref:Signal peptidase I, archaeal type n=1 Tax=Archaeoglobus sulfaticallidus PM70-1 TaxID=387631 RepID=N0BF24_9EURY|nr:signal peptidase I [Archaeoglobus sulfaticallidus]AGK61623.1 signal peptidase I, archaeal type [Archaeoglobus sulfaticallidus PM70-1]
MESSKLIGIAREIISTLVIVGIIVGAGILITGTWPFMVAIESGSMEPHMHVGDVVILMSPDRVGITTYVEGVEKNYKAFGDYGDVIVYHPNGDRSKTPVIHRVIAYVEKGEHIPVKIGNKLYLSKYVADHSGYVTQGDHNNAPDQPIISSPVKKEWIVGVAKLRIPLIGYIRLIFS